MGDTEVFVGLTGARLAEEAYDLGGGLSLHRTYVHLMKPLMMAFSPAEAGKPHPGPWKTVTGSSGHDIEIELHVGTAYDNTVSFDTINAAWWIISLLRLRSAPRLFAPLVSDSRFSQSCANSPGPGVLSLETGRLRIAIGESKPLLDTADLDWIKTHWQGGARLMRSSKPFNLAYQAFDQGAFSGDPDLYLLALWSGLEALFSSARTELRFRISALISAYLEEPGADRLALQKQIAKLYDARSATVHGSSTTSHDDLIATHQLSRRIILKILNDMAVPTNQALEERLFGL